MTITDEMVERAGADAGHLVTRDQIARTLAESFYGGGHIYDASTEQVIEAKWRDWRPQADDLLKVYAIFHRRAALETALSKREG